MVNGKCIIWSSKKKRTMALSSTKAESVALSEVMQEAVWLKVFMCEIGEIAKEKAVKIYDDNQGAIALSKKPKLHKRSKHIDIRYLLVRKKAEDVQVVRGFAQHKTCYTKPNTAEHFEIMRTSWEFKRRRL